MLLNVLFLKTKTVLINAASLKTTVFVNVENYCSWKFLFLKTGSFTRSCRPFVWKWSSRLFPLVPFSPAPADFRNSGIEGTKFNGLIRDFFSFQNFIRSFFNKYEWMREENLRLLGKGKNRWDKRLNCYAIKEIIDSAGDPSDRRGTFSGERVGGRFRRKKGR